MSAKFSLRYSAADAKRVLVVLLGCELLLVLGYVVTRIVLDGRGGPIATPLDIDREASIPTWFFAVQLAVISLLLLAQTRLTSELRGFLLLLALGFLYLSVDEASAIHEKISETVDRQLAWVVPFLEMSGISVVLYGFMLSGLQIHAASLPAAESAIVDSPLVSKTLS